MCKLLNMSAIFTGFQGTIDASSLKLMATKKLCKLMMCPACHKTRMRKVSANGEPIMLNGDFITSTGKYYWNDKSYSQKPKMYVAFYCVLIRIENHIRIPLCHILNDIFVFVFMSVSSIPIGLEWKGKVVPGNIEWHHGEEQEDLNSTFDGVVRILKDQHFKGINNIFISISYKHHPIHFNVHCFMYSEMQLCFCFFFCSLEYYRIFL